MLNSAYFYTFLLIVLFYICLLFYIKISAPKKNNKRVLFVSTFDRYYVESIYYDMLMLSCYFLGAVGMCLIYRGSVLNVVTPIETFDKAFNYIFLTKCILFLLNITYYFKILNLLFQDYSVKIHLYLTQYEWYTYLNTLERDRYKWASATLNEISSYFYYRVCSEKQFRKLFYISQINADENKNILESKEYKSWVYVQERVWLWYFYKILMEVFNLLSSWASLFLYYLLHSVVLVILVYDISQGELYYIYYALMIFFIMQFIRKIRNFFQEKDPVWDDVIMRYFYKNNVPYEKIRESLAKEIYLNNEMANTIRAHQGEIRSYVESNFKVDYVRDPERVISEKDSHSYAKRLNVIFLAILAVIYNLIYPMNYFFVIHTWEIPLNYVLLPLVLGLSYVNYHIFWYEEEKLQKREVFKWLSRIIIFALLIPMAYFTLKNKIVTLSSETLFNIKDFIVFKESFSLEQKQKYLMHYIKYLQKIYGLSEYQVNLLFLQMEQIISTNTTLAAMRSNLSNIIDSWANTPLKLPLSIKDLFSTIVDKIKSWFNK